MAAGTSWFLSCRPKWFRDRAAATVGKMTVNTPIAPPIRPCGITIVEILVVISVLLILISFAVPGIDRATARAEIRAASENIQYSIETARKMARRSESSVTLYADPPDGAAGQHIRLSGPGLGAAMGAQDYRLPDSVRVVSDRESFTFDGRGLVMNPGKLVLVARFDDAIVSELSID